MDSDKEAYLDEATKALRRQRKLIQDLEKEKQELNRQVRTARSKRNSRKDSENAAKISRLAEEQVHCMLVWFHLACKTAVSSTRRTNRTALTEKLLLNFQEVLVTSIEEERQTLSDLSAETTRIERQIAHQRRAAAAKANPVATNQPKGEQVIARFIG